MGGTGSDGGSRGGVRGGAPLGCGAGRRGGGAARGWGGERRVASDGATAGGEGRSDGPLPRQRQHAADHTRPKSMWSRVTKRCCPFTKLMDQYFAPPVNYVPGCWTGIDRLWCDMCTH
ncbi:hypothetical protein GCM10023324_27670 [Streptomyces youssoufiensis]